MNIRPTIYKSYSCSCSSHKDSNYTPNSSAELNKSFQTRRTTKILEHEEDEHFANVMNKDKLIFPHFHSVFHLLYTDI